MGLEGRDPKAAIREQATEGGDKSALAGVGGGAKDHEEAGHEVWDGVQVYLPFGMYCFVEGNELRLEQKYILSYQIRIGLYRTLTRIAEPKLPIS